MSKKKPEERPILPKHKAFAEATLVPGKSMTDAYVEVYGLENRDVAAVAASRLAKHPNVQRHIRQVLDMKHPNRAEVAGDVIMEILTNPDSPGALKLKAVEALARLEGWNAPTRTENLSAKVDLSKKYKLPGSDK